ncbi:hypothetical protein GCM10025789_24010 [Tessaracoccus lubricantis]|uniref:PspA-associated domain-containing protein n=1 Tax=Tessaracoccus lubricantis TaxID=545543 RepID=A0ABP9FKC5_9ACTN
MIVRIMGRGQWVLEPEHLIELNELDRQLEDAVEKGDQEALAASLRALSEGVRRLGVEVPDDVIAESDLVLPDTDASVEEVRELLDSTSEYYGIFPDADGELAEGDQESTVL